MWIGSAGSSCRCGGPLTHLVIMNVLKLILSSGYLSDLSCSCGASLTHLKIMVNL